MCFSSIVLFSVIALIVLYLKIQSGSLGGLVYTGIAIVENIGENFKLLFNVNVEAIETQLLDSPLKNIGSNYEAIRLYALNTIQNYCNIQKYYKPEISRATTQLFKITLSGSIICLVLTWLFS